ncbi:AcrR family transcriptional regulator [Actinoplanes octamycinicus]|uniref:AcrR family transcriptional regulator n=1 Tax=Actinoplanes octamycinicus TaxID=135948 RepID=A0A7W7H6Y4_9ACTN|nr:TetR/AcrR family transcriptional regulator [Actinoplanes octamycinicus]MBB4744957.1 AcrR family transcriptional regulator [Actinoplanes octamycinicus]GIE55543.1 TetR family transcriptional regulator [Actinoplanes octamycinicus]
MPTTRPGPRERLLEAARDLTYDQGVHVGVDAILQRAEVARRSLYQHFGGKDGLVTEMLRANSNEARYRAVMDAAGTDPRARILAVFDELDVVVSRETFRGCRFTAAELALADPAHPAHAEVRGYKERLHALFSAELTDLGHPDPDLGATQLLVLIDGVLAHGVTRPRAHPARAAKAVAALILGVPPARDTEFLQTDGDGQIS